MLKALIILENHIIFKIELNIQLIYFICLNLPLINLLIQDQNQFNIQVI